MVGGDKPGTGEFPVITGIRVGIREAGGHVAIRCPSWPREGRTGGADIIDNGIVAIAYDRAGAGGRQVSIIRYQEGRSVASVASHSMIEGAAGFRSEIGAGAAGAESGRFGDEDLVLIGIAGRVYAAAILEGDHASAQYDGVSVIPGHSYPEGGDDEGPAVGQGPVGAWPYIAGAYFVPYAHKVQSGRGGRRDAKGRPPHIDTDLVVPGKGGNFYKGTRIIAGRQGILPESGSFVVHQPEELAGDGVGMGRKIVIVSHAIDLSVTAVRIDICADLQGIAGLHRATHCLFSEIDITVPEFQWGVGLGEGGVMTE